MRETAAGAEPREAALLWTGRAAGTHLHRRREGRPGQAFFPRRRLNRQVLTNKHMPVCIEPGCTRKTPVRENWHTIPEQYRDEQDSHHHRCRLHYVHRLLARYPAKTVRTRKAWQCAGCESPIPRGSMARLAFRSAGVRLRYPERVYVCLDCASSDEVAPCQDHAARGA